MKLRCLVCMNIHTFGKSVNYCIHWCVGHPREDKMSYTYIMTVLVFEEHISFGQGKHNILVLVLVMLSWQTLL